ncbi:MAG TPA: methionine aminotransferase [Bacteroidales bacterium]|nr:methionine aminotransferase [Bacteroidales bacterium]HSA42179.1 methionine aminotransferase [Bacteroidales bacterium]
MELFPGNIQSKLPHTGTSIFAIMTKLALQHKAINLSQGFPDFSVAPKLISLVNKYMNKGYNQYAPMQGILPLRKAISEKVRLLYGAAYDPEQQINITAGGTQALSSVIEAFIRDDDEVILFEPAYDSYAPVVKLNNGIVKYAGLKLPDYHIDWAEVRKMITARTRMIIINSPQNPTGAVLGPEDMQQLIHLTENTDILILSDEVYEHLIFDHLQHESVARYPQLARRAFVVGSFGKTFHATGWKLGFVLAPENLMAEFRKTHQFIVFTCNTPVQYAIADYLREKDSWQSLGSFYQQKRDYFTSLLTGSRFEVIPSHGTYFQLLSYRQITDMKDTEYATFLTRKHKIASIPVSVFYNKKDDHGVLRFCFAKRDETLEKAANILCKI